MILRIKHEINMTLGNKNVGFESSNSIMAETNNTESEKRNGPMSTNPVSGRRG